MVDTSLVANALLFKSDNGALLRIVRTSANPNYSFSIKPMFRNLTSFCFLLVIVLRDIYFGKKTNA